MGNCFSDPSSHPSSSKTKVTGGGQKLGSGPSRASVTPANPPPQPRYNEPPRTLGGTTAITGDASVSDGGGDEAQRERMILAAEERARSASSKGVSSSNPKAGQLSAKLAAERRAAANPQQQDQRLMDKGEWN